MTQTASALRGQIASLTAGTDDNTLLASWIATCTARLDTEGDTARTLTIAMDAIESELISRGMTADEFSALFLATIAAHDAR